MSEETSLPIETTCLDVNNLQKENADFLLLDCREQNEFDLVRIEGSTLIPMSELQDRVGELEPHRQRHIVVHCHHGGRSMRVTQWLRQQGFPKVQNMAGGINAWAQDIDPSMATY
ncbi:rhodanese-like domain-containing protein [Bremerella sp. JC817]|uniref:rhodanese-like domain-containing protein n=1 Tax=Bremerella sp. JC817 TaxID=3231756 RepID=UPI00345AEF7E